VELLKLTGEVDFDPKNKGVFDATKKNWAENYDLDLEQINKVKQQLDQYDVGSARKKKEERKSQKKDIKAIKRTPNLTDKEDSPRVGTGNLALEDLISSLHRELRYQREKVENIKSTVMILKKQVSEEAEQTPVLSTKLQAEIATIRNEASDDQQEQRNIQHFLENLQHAVQVKHEAQPLTKHEKMMQSAPVGHNSNKKKRPPKGHEKK